MTTIIGSILVVALVAFGAAFAVNKPFRTKVLQVLRIKSDQALDGATSAIDKERDSYNQLIAKLPAQRTAVTKVMGNATLAQKTLAEKEAAMEATKQKYATAKQLGASEAALDSLGADFTAATQAVVAQKAVVEAAVAASTEARNALEATIKAIQKFGDQVESDQNKAELTAALKTTADARQATQDINNQISQAGAAHHEVDRQLEEARAANELSKGSATDIELADLEEKAAAKSGRDALEASLG